jgi:hypothetical protein
MAGLFYQKSLLLGYKQNFLENSDPKHFLQKGYIYRQVRVLLLIVVSLRPTLALR